MTFARILRTFTLMAIVSVVLPSFAGADLASISGKVTYKKLKYVKNTVVYIENLPAKVGEKPESPKTARMDQIKKKFIPFVLPVVKGASVEFLNNDNTDHNVFSPDGEKYDLGTWSKGNIVTRKFEKEGVYTQLCKVHPSMLAYIVVLQNSHFAVTDEEGNFKIEGVPPGDYKLAVWNERRNAKPVAVRVPEGGLDGVEIALTR